MTLSGQIELLSQAISENGILTVEGNPYSLSKCFDENGIFVGVELMSRNYEDALIEAPECTLWKELLQESEGDITLDSVFQDGVKLCTDDDEIILCDEEPILIITGNIDGELNVDIGVPKNAASQLKEMTGKERTR